MSPQLPRLTRRRLLGAGLVAGGAIGVTALGLTSLRQAAPAVSGLLALTPAQHRTMRLAAQAHVPPGGPFAWSAADVDVAGLFDRFVADQPAAEAREARLALDLLDLGPLLFERRWTTFCALDDADRLAHWRAWSLAPQATRREVWRALASFVGMAVYDQPGAWAAVGYRGPSLARR